MNSEAAMATSHNRNAPLHFKTMEQADVPQGRNGKHKTIISAILKDLE